MQFQFSSKETAWESLSDLTRYINEHHSEHAKALLELTIYVKTLEENPAQGVGPSSAIEQLAEIQLMLTEALETVNLFGEREKEFEAERQKLISDIREAERKELSAKSDTSLMISKADGLDTELKGLREQLKLVEEGTITLRDMLRDARQKMTLAEAMFAEAKQEASEWKRKVGYINKKMKGLRDCTEDKEKLTIALADAEKHAADLEAESVKWKGRAVSMRDKLKKAGLNGSTKQKEIPSARQPVAIKDAQTVSS